MGQPPKFIEVRPGQVWIDNDKRVSYPRHLKIMRVDGEYAFCLECLEDGQIFNFREYRILLRRFRPTATGYRLVKEAAHA